jgi:hypothetical protein
VSRLDFGPETDAIEVTDIETGHMVFAAVSGTTVSLRELTSAIHGAGYEIAKASLTARGLLRPGMRLWVPNAEQEVALTGDEERMESLRGVAPETAIVVTGSWGEDGDSQVITVDSFSISQQR